MFFHKGYDALGRGRGNSSNGKVSRASDLEGWSNIREGLGKCFYDIDGIRGAIRGGLWVWLAVALAVVAVDCG